MSTTIPRSSTGDTQAAVPYRVALMSGRARAAYLVFAALWLASVVWFWLWWLRPGHQLDTYLFVASSVALIWTTLVPGYFVSIVARARVQNPATPLPQGLRVAMVVTKAPSEPFSVLQRTLLAMLAQKYPHDTWLADEDVSPTTAAWCDAHGVKISTRKGVAEYHNATWPRRTRCKEGNLAYFYDHYGYDNYDFVVQLDADHVPAEGYLEEMLRPFADPSIGYVSAPSICDNNAARSWSARGRLYVEASFHGTMQVGYNGGLAPTCIGSHYAVRTRALREAGGLGPELAEDHSTTLLLNAAGWRGMHAIGAIAHGDGPDTFADLATQEFQWSKSLVTILLRHSKHYLGKLPLRLRAQFLFCQLWYPLTSFTMALGFCLPIVALCTGRMWSNRSYPDYILHTGVMLVAMLGVLEVVRRIGSFRPQLKRTLTWEGSAFLLARWPWVLMGTLSAVVDVVRGREFAFRVTPKGMPIDHALPTAVVAPYLLLSVAAGLPVVLVPNAYDAAGFYVLCWIGAAFYFALAVWIAVAHAREAGRSKGVLTLLLGDGGAWRRALFVVAAVVLAGGAALRAGPGVSAILWTPANAAGEAKYGVYDPGEGFSSNRNIAINHIFVSWTSPEAGATIANAYTTAKSQNRWLMITVEPWPAADRSGGKLLPDIAKGAYDANIREVCAQIGALEAPVYLRWGHEMEVPPGRYPWAANDPSAYVKAYRHVVDQCRPLARKAYFVWSPAGDPSLARYFPGEGYADFVGISVFDCPKCHADGAVHADASALEILRTKYRRVDSFHLPVIVAELGIDGAPDHRDKTLHELADAMSEFRRVHAVIYFNAKDNPGAWPVAYIPDWRIAPQTIDAPSLPSAASR